MNFIGVYDNHSLLLQSGSTISYRGEGESTESILLLHGLNGHSGTWRKTIPFFSRTKKMIAPSLPPWRKSIHELDIDWYVKQVFELLEGLNVRNVSVIGNSMGGWIAMRMAVAKPELIKTMVLEDSAGVTDPHEEELINNLNSTAVPVMIIWGSEDRILPVSAGRYLHSRLVSSQLRIFEGAGHVPHWEKPEEFNSTVFQFFEVKEKTT